jgi:hypothetical protein
MLSRRQLGKLELAWGKNMRAGSGALLSFHRLQGTMDVSKINGALTRLQKMYPLLTARVENRHQELFFTSKDVDSVQLKTEKVNSPHELQLALEAALNEPMDWSVGPLLRATLWQFKHTRNEWGLCLLGHPSVLDSASLHQVAVQLLTFLEQGLPEESTPVLPCPVLPALEKMIPEEPIGLDKPLRLAKFAFEQLWSQLMFRPKLPFQNLTSNGEPSPSAETFFLRRSLTKDQSNSLERACREHGLGLQSALWASFVISAYRMNHVHLSSVAYQLMTPCSVRGFLEPPVPKHVVGCFSSFVSIPERVGASSDFWSLAHRLKTRFDRAILEGDPLSFVSFATQLADFFNGRLARSLCSLQLVDSEKMPDSLRKGNIKVLESFEVQGAGAFGNHCSLGVSHGWESLTLTFAAHTRIMDREHAQSMLNLIVETLAHNTGVDLLAVEKDRRVGAESEARVETSATNGENNNARMDKSVEMDQILESSNRGKSRARRHSKRIDQPES